MMINNLWNYYYISFFGNIIPKFHILCNFSFKKRGAKKKIKIAQKERFFSFLIFTYKDETYIEQRQSKDIWKGQHQFPLHEEEKKVLENISQINKVVEKRIEQSDFELEAISKVFLQQLTHQKLTANFIEIKLKSPLNKHFLNVNIKNLSKFAFPKIINVYLEYKSQNKNDK